MTQEKSLMINHHKLCGHFHSSYDTCCYGSFTSFIPSSYHSVQNLICLVTRKKDRCDCCYHSCDLPVPFNWKWDHISDIQLADPGFGTPGKIDLLLGVNVFTDVMCHDRQTGPPGSPVAFGWVLAGSIDSCNVATHVATHHVSHFRG